VRAINSHARESAELRDIEVEQALVDAVTLNDVALDEELVRIAADVAYWGARYADAMKEHLMVEHEYETLRDRAMIEEREKLRAHAEAKNAGKKTKAKEVTESEVKTYVGLREDVQELKLHEIEARVDKERMRRYADAVAVKKDALQSLGARQRVEMERDPAVRRRYTNEREARRGGGDEI